MGSERVIRQAVALGAEVEHGLAGLEDLPYTVTISSSESDMSVQMNAIQSFLLLRFLTHTILAGITAFPFSSMLTVTDRRNLARPQRFLHAP